MSTTTRPESTGGNRGSKLRAPADGLLAGARRPSAPQRGRNRSWGLITLAALLVIGLGLAVAAWGLSAGDRQSVLAIGAPVAKGQVIEREDLVSVSISGASQTIPVASIDSVIGQTAASDLVEGQILSPAAYTSQAVPAAGESIIGLALDPSRVPGAGLEPGDVADVIAVPGGEGDQQDALDEPEVLSAAAAVYDVAGSSTAGGQVLVTLIVDADDAARIAAYSTANRVALVEISSAEETTAPQTPETTEGS